MPVGQECLQATIRYQSRSALLWKLAAQYPDAVEVATITFTAFVISLAFNLPKWWWSAILPNIFSFLLAVLAVFLYMSYVRHIPSDEAFLAMRTSILWIAIGVGCGYVWH
ncbi:hypothetical protein [Paraburkholderia hospita]|uniref:hypothetical protein n=1 Tax=Paraburkholderia hospita TaxID=169430 RepID=UPI00117787CF|nr:hypothetical protein [Paraburkholderia hospita]